MLRVTATEKATKAPSTHSRGAESLSALNGGLGFSAFASFSQVSFAESMLVMPDRINDHMMFSMGPFDLSMEGLLIPSACKLVSGMLVGSGLEYWSHFVFASSNHLSELVWTSLH